MLAFTAREEIEVDEAIVLDGMSAITDSGILIRNMNDADLERILELRSVVRWSADPRAFDLLRGVRGARWAVAESPEGDLAGMVGAVPLGEIGILCHLAVHDGYRGFGLGALLSSWAVTYLRSRGAKTIRLYSTRKAEGLYRSLGFEEVAPRTVYRLEEGHRRIRMPDRVDGHRVETLTLGDLPELYGVDHWSYGADRSALLLATLRLHPGLGLVARDSSGGMKGYLIRSSQGRATRIGPLPGLHPGRCPPPSRPRPLRHRCAGPDHGLRSGRIRGPLCPARIRLRGHAGTGCGWSWASARGDSQAGLVHYGTTAYLAT